MLYCCGCGFSMAFFLSGAPVSTSMTGRYLYRDFTPLSTNICPACVSNSAMIKDEVSGKLQSFANHRSRRGVHPIAMSIPRGSAGVIVHHMAPHFPSLAKQHGFVPSRHRVQHG